MLCVVERAVTNGSDDLAENEQWVAVQVVRGSAGHHHCSTHVERRQDHREQGTAPAVDAEANGDA